MRLEHVAEDKQIQNTRQDRCSDGLEADFPEPQHFLVQERAEPGCPLGERCVYCRLTERERRCSARFCTACGGSEVQGRIHYYAAIRSRPSLMICRNTSSRSA